ncbi:MAG: hypothetical protein LBB23_02605 [Rickettsiales bacterium]|nr:hypothetical protein [Rickettsiales bacterium]
MCRRSRQLIDHYPVRLRFATARHPFASEGDLVVGMTSEKRFGVGVIE